MKKLFSSVLFVVLFVVLFMWLGTIDVSARQFESAINTGISTFPVTGDNYRVGVVDLIVSSVQPKVLIKEIEISNDNADVTAQTVTLYDNFANDASSASVTAIWTVTIGSGTVGGTNWIYSKTFYGADRGLLKADYGVAARKSSTAGNVRISIQYK